ncbi:hypothetical protein [Pseudemcibacter aquimaris]|uniref:hypothetical protein n=1 Tax=Pseudemcibacter aquimaris TaxID=2857064 RepID=UPI002011F7DD|nr:hypothetical protein [Pseudemcibacter aquimaris]MCC3859917.1 hypothetical protein [Pseudemcibacter aquimaris]WDU57249.1 hypothetical protein KW060_08565 [Pseudemcibacter aquimaris]
MMNMGQSVSQGYSYKRGITVQKNFWTRYWVYFTTADYLGLFVGLMIYGYNYYPFEYDMAHRIMPDFMTLMSATGSVFFIWYIKSFYLPVQLIAFYMFKNDARSQHDYRAHFRIIVLLIHASIITGFMTTPNGKQIFIPLGCILVFNVAAFLLLENRERRRS